MTHSRLRQVLVLLVAVALGFTASLVPFIWPTTSDPHQADAVIILSGDHGERLPQALRLMNLGVAPTLVFDGTLDRAMENDLCRGGSVPYEVLCLRPQPDSTRYEARAAARLAKSRQWRTLVVVTSTQHITRSSFLFRRCFGGRLEMVAGRPALSAGERVRNVAHEWLGMAYALTIGHGC